MTPAVGTARERFRELHERGCFVIPNPWDVGKAMYLASLGLKALATTSAGFAVSEGQSDESLDRDSVLRHCAEMVAATSLPVNADFQAGYGDSPEAVAESVRLCEATGVAGLSIEDSRSGDGSLYDLAEALDRLRAAKEALGGSGVLLVARTEGLLLSQPPPLSEVVARLQAYSEAGADVLFAPGVRSAADIRVLVEAVGPKPLNVLALPGMGLSLGKYSDLGVRRISVGSGLARAAWSGFIGASDMLAQQGSFEWLEGLARLPDLSAASALS